MGGMNQNENGPLSKPECCVQFKSISPTPRTPVCKATKNSSVEVEETRFFSAGEDNILIGVVS